MKKLKEFITWVGKQKGFEGMNSDQVITALNEMSSSEEGKEEVAKLMSAFKQDQKIGSASEVLKAQSGATLRRAQRQEYRNAMNEYRNDDEMNKYRRGYLRDMARERANAVQVPTPEVSIETPVRRFDRGEYRDIAVKHNILDRQTRTDYDGDVHERYRVANPGDKRVLIKKAKAAATEGFDESMYNFDPNQTFDRDRFRDRKRVARTINPEWNWRQRRAFALKDGEGIQNIVSRTIDPKDPNIELPSVWNKKLDIPGFTRGKATVSVGNIGIADIEHLPEEKKYTLVTKEAKIAPKRMGFNQFAGMLDDRMRAQKSLSTGSDTTNFQAWRANEYKKYAADPGNYTWTAMPNGYKASRQEMQQLAAEGLLANKRGTGYYDPSDNSQAYIFGNKSWMQQHIDKGLDPTKRTYSFVDQHGNPVTNEQELAIAASQIKDPEVRKYFERYLNTGERSTTIPSGTVAAQEQNVGKVGQSDFSRAMANTALGIAGSAGVMAALDAGAAKMVWDGTKWVVKRGLRYADDVIKRGRDVYGNQFDDAARAYMRNHGGHGRFQPQRWAGQYTYNQLPNGRMAGRVWQWTGGKPSFGSFIGGHAPYVPGNMIMPFLKTGGKIEK